MTMTAAEATALSSKPLEAEQVDAIRKAAFGVGKAEGNLEAATILAIEAVKNNGGFGLVTVRNEYWVGYMAGRMAKTNSWSPSAKLLEEAAAMREGNSPKAKTVKVGKPTRSPEWEAAYGAARKSWERLIDKMGVATPEARGGARERDTSKPEAGETENEGAETAANTTVKATEPKAPTVPKVVDRKAANAWFARETAIINTFCLYNKDHVDEAIAVKVDTFRRELLAMLKD